MTPLLGWANLRSGDLQADAGDKLAEQVLGFLGEWSVFRTELASGHPLESAQHLFAVRRKHCLGTTGKKTSQAKALVKDIS